VSKLTEQSPQQTCPDQGMRRTSACKAFKGELWKCLKFSKTKVIHKQMRLIPEIIPEFENIMTYSNSLLSKKRSKKELTKRPPFLVKSLVWKSSEKTVNGGWRDGRTLEPF
jgi:hypothetical protein